ncbi:unnamed protein product [Haemonchus placei]|uniref:Uncharacterized protein n=1 Tax=Haemonchus placei TaxID=6290 RepID=A0A0N4WDB8_HAEPC|nr:unnamed protein product [Haemonchus placei]
MKIAVIRPPSHRRRCDELFPDGFNDEEDFTVDDVDRIEEHISRYLAAVHLSRGEFREAERRLIYAKSMESKDLLIKVYQKWVKDGRLNEQERDNLLNIVQELEQTSLCDADESFFSVKSDLSDHTLSNGSLGRNSASSDGRQAFGNTFDGRKVEESEHTGNLTIDKQEKFRSASSMTTSRSVTVAIPEEREISKEEPLPDIGDGTTSVVRKPTYEMSISAVSSISVIPSQATTSTPATATVSNLPPIVANSPFGKFITSKEAAASYWKSGKPPKPVFGTVPPCISSSQQKPEQGNAANMSPVLNTCSSLKGTAQPPATGSICSGTSGTVHSPFSSERSQKNIAGSQGQVPISRSSSNVASNNFMQPHPDVCALEEEFLDDDESFCNSLIIELCKKQLERSPRKIQSTNFADLGALQERMAQIAIQMQNTENQPRTSMITLPLPPSPSIARTAPTEAQILSEQQQECLIELEQKVAQLMRPTVQPTKNTVFFMAGDDPVSVSRGSTSGVVSSRSPSHPDRLGWDHFGDPLKRMEQLARHPDTNGVCFGCLDDDGQDHVIKALDRLAYEWNNASDSDDE